jgi:Transposase DDE domain
MDDVERERDWSLIENALPEGWRALAAEMGVIKKRPPHMGQKIVDIGIALRLVLHYVAQRGSQRATIAGAAAAGLVTISQVALFKWMRKVGRYLEALVGRMVEPGTYASDRWGGYVLVVADATTVERPGATGTTARVHYGMHLCDLRPRFIRVTDASVGETMRNYDPDPGELWIVDRGYSNPPSVQFVVDRRSDLLVRYNAASLPVFDVHGRRIDTRTEVSRTTRRGRAKGRKVYVRTRDERLFAVRLCWMRLSASDAAKARARAKRDGADASEVEAAEYIVVLTTVPRSRLDDNSIIALYRARWQVELDFKRDKSVGQLDTLPSELPETIHSWLCAKILLGLIARRLASQDVGVPPSGLADLILPRVNNEAPHAGRRRRALVRDAVGLDRSAKRASACQAA